MTQPEIAAPLPAPARSRAQRPLPLRVLRTVGRFARRKPLGFVGALMVAFFVVLAVFAPLIAPHDPEQTHLRDRLIGPSSDYWLGTDQVGHDVLSRLIFGARLSLTIGVASILVASAAATVIAVVSAYSGGWVDNVIQRFVDAWIALPNLVILITFLGIVRRTDANMILAMVLAFAFLYTATATRVIRSAVIEIRDRPFVEAADAAGASPIRIMANHVLPNIFPLILITATVAVPGAILAEASLSFLGFGPAGEPSWGQMLSVDGREFFRTQPGLAVYPGLCIAFTVFGFNMFGDALRDVLDPRLRGSRH
ncbi:MAG: ABC transporter permease subunit [Dehalococcoidia bacterium]|nr:ABC transporter permease subunit [Dehalococcoidia bacterium]